MWKPAPPPFRRHKKDQLLKQIAVSQFIYQLDESPLLRQKSKLVPIKDISSKDFKNKAAYLKTCLRKFRKLTGLGRGITAVQVGIPERFSVIYIPARNARLALAGETEAKREALIIINPRITRKSVEKLLYPEMCMSANPVIAPVARPAWIEFEYYDEHEIKQYWDMKAEDSVSLMYNRVLQHEIDHMDGIINIDLIDSKRIIFESDPDFYKSAKFENV